MNNNKRPLGWLLLSCLFFVLVSFMGFSHKPNPQKQTLKKIVIDAGHGGKDFGASGKYSNEKDIALAVALKLQQLVHDQLPDVEVYMTRTTDVFDHVTVKADKANAAGGDLFISIHVNYTTPEYRSEVIGHKTVSYKRKGKRYTKQVPEYRSYSVGSKAKGTETFIWGVGKNESKAKALKENESLYMDSSLSSEMKDFDPDDPAKMVLYSLKTQQFFDRSFNLANTVEDEFKKVGRISREAKQRQKGIWVLQAVAMPAILVETGFISNPEEEDYLNSPAGQTEIAQCITNALRRYRYSLEHKIIRN